MKFWVPCIMGLMVLLAFFKCFRDALLARASANWPSTDGTLHESTLVESRRRRGSTPMYQAKVKYSYSVNGREYTSTIKGYHHNASGDQDFHASHPVGARVTVHFNPSNPGQAVLEKGDSYTNYLTLVALLVAIIVCGLVAMNARS